MAIIKEFNGLRPVEKYAKDIAALPYDVYSRSEAKAIGDKNKNSFLHIDKAEISFDNSVDQYDDRVYIKAKENLEKLILENKMEEDKEKCMYIYTINCNNKDHTGLVSCTCVDDYINEVIKKHELTRQDKEDDRIRHIKALEANTGPIFMTYKFNEKVNSIIENFKSCNSPVYDFIDEGVGQKVWVIDDVNIINSLKILFEKIDNLYIADGHHRNAAAVAVALEKRKNGGNATDEYNYYLSIMFPDNQVNIMDYNRVIKDLNGLTNEEFLEKLKEKFHISKGNGIPREKGEFGLYLDKQWYKLNIKDQYKKDDVINSLDVAILQNEVLEKIFNIVEIRTDKRIDFVGGIRGIEELEKRVDSGEMKVAFSMYPTSIEELMNVADSGNIMPPKSTWFEPKLRSGLFIHKF